MTKQLALSIMVTLGGLSVILESFGAHSDDDRTQTLPRTRLTFQHQGNIERYLVTRREKETRVPLLNRLIFPSPFCTKLRHFCWFYDVTVGSVAVRQ
jgi:hypothetical protein